MTKTNRWLRIRETHFITIIIFLAAVVVFSPPICAQEKVYLPFNSTRVRALGIGGAVTALPDNFGASAFNPGNYDFYSTRDGFRLTMSISPLMPAIVLKYPEQFFGQAGFDDNIKAYAAIISLIKSVNINYRNLNIGVVLGEPTFLVPEFSESKQLINANSLYWNHTNSLMLNFKLADQVAIGAGLHLIYFSEGNRRNYAYANSYGIMMQPKSYFRVGINIFNLPKEVEEGREIYDDISNEAIGIGTAIFFPFKTTFSFDIRNLALDRIAKREKYLFGLESQVIKHVALRSGLKVVDFAARPGFSFGLGLLNSNSYHTTKYKLNHNNYLLNYAVIFNTFQNKKYAIHSFSFTIHL